MEEVKKLNRTRRYGSVLPIGRESYTREINEASEEDVDPDNADLKGKGTGVVCFLWKDGCVNHRDLKGVGPFMLTLTPSCPFLSPRTCWHAVFVSSDPFETMTTINAYLLKISSWDHTHSRFLTAFPNHSSCHGT